ncbi:MAG TPA: hypoxanthine phosphoribosyltransferase [Coleofasciculaceae cyanobacterium]
MEDTLTSLVSTLEIADAVKRLAQEIDRDYANRSPVIVVVLKGAFMFAADLVRAMQTPIQNIEFIRLSSYGSATVSAGEVSVMMELNREAIANQDVIVVEDIIDTGATTAQALQELQTYQPASLKLCALLDKPDRRKVAVAIDYLGLSVPDRFIVGYGMDFDQKYRQLSAIYTL